MICKKCNIDKPESHFEFRNDTQKYRTSCRMCDKGYRSVQIENQESILRLYKLDLKKCGRCEEIKELHEFGIDKHTVTGLSSLCKQCIREKAKAPTSREQNYKKKYGITLEEVEEKLVNNDNKCEICNDDITGKHFIDHDHKTGKFRGVLCKHCNWALGHFRDNQQFLFNAIEYLEKNK